MREYERLMTEAEAMRFTIERKVRKRTVAEMSAERIKELRDVLTDKCVFEEFDEVIFRKTVEWVIVYEDYVTFKFTDYLERTVPIPE